ncbi:hypothetical protein MIS45_09440 [Wielerella bovis]|uniref:hypothetical protein n=1 Tax=Wielerella bovis TaxID=2917790 RepID=UPI00201868DE|nr:hypothetical protein [Wielerella bovis]ULJ68970.1 hypothetical protein MIS45_09440 [Wielerella bovis]
MDNQEIVTSSNSTPGFQLMNFIEIITKLFPILSVLALILVFMGISTIFLFSLITPYFVPEYLNQEKIPLIMDGLEFFSNTNYYAKLIITNTIVMCFFVLEIILDADIKYCSFFISCSIFILLVVPLFFFWKKEKTDIITILVTSFIIITSSVHLWIERVEFKYIFSILFFMIFVGYTWQCTISQTKFERMKSFLIVLLCLPISFFVSTVFFILMAINIADKGHQNDASWYLFIVFFVAWLLVYAVNGFFAFHLCQNKKKFEIWYLFIPCIMLFLIAYVLIFFDKGRQLPRLILKPLHFIEYPSNANWYTIDTRFFAPNNLTTSELESNSNDLKQYFNYKTIQDTGLQCTLLDSQCQFLSDKDKRKAQCEQKENQFKNERKYNRFYGYVAWNLGDMKVFCPHGYEQARLETQKEKKSNPIQCLALKSEYIIPYY